MRRDLLCQGNPTEEDSHFIVGRGNRSYSGWFDHIGLEIDSFSSHDVKGVVIHLGVPDLSKTYIDGLDLTQEHWDREFRCRTVSW
jgi:hypothetical protein